MSPTEMQLFRAIENIFRECCLGWGYEEVRTPILEYLYLFTAAGTLTPGRLGKVYSFLDWDGWSGERVVLRPDGTIPVARYYIETRRSGLARLFYVSNVFSFEETGRETREKWQCGAELIGSRSLTSDIELIVLALELLQKLGFRDLELRLSHAGLIRAILSKFEIDPEEQHRLIDRISDGDIRVLTGEKPELARVIAPLLNNKGKSSGFLKNISVMLGRDFPELLTPITEFTDLVAALDSLDITYQIDISSGRGFEYYTGLIFQLYAGEHRVAGGGRYDALIPLLGGKDIPASGFAIYVDKLMELSRVDVAVGQAKERVLVQLQTGINSLKAAFEAVKALHQNGFIAEIISDDISHKQADWLLEIRETGWRYLLRNTRTDTQYEVAVVQEIVARLKG